MCLAGLYQHRVIIRRSPFHGLCALCLSNHWTCKCKEGCHQSGSRMPTIWVKIRPDLQNSVTILLYECNTKISEDRRSLVFFFFFETVKFKNSWVLVEKWSREKSVCSSLYHQHQSLIGTVAEGYNLIHFVFIPKKWTVDTRNDGTCVFLLTFYYVGNLRAVGF